MFNFKITKLCEDDDSIAYTCLAPALHANKLNTPDPEPIYNTTLFFKT